MEKEERDYLDEAIEHCSKSDPAFRAEWAVHTLVLELVRRRIDLGLTQQDVAKRMGIARSRVAEIENGGATTSSMRIAAYADAVGMKLGVSKVAEPRAEYGGKGRRPGSKRVK